MVIETWNEPNIDAFWRPYPQPARWAKLHAVTYHAAKSVDPKTTVLAGGFAGTISSDGRQEMTVSKFLNSAYATGKLANTVDALSIHLYSNNERPMGPGTLFAESLYDIRQARDSPRAAGQARSGSPRPGSRLRAAGRLSGEKQADGLIRRYKKLMTMDDIDGMIIHTAIDQRERAPTDRAYGFGLVSNPVPLIVKPAYCEFAGRASDNPPGGCKRITEKPGDGDDDGPADLDDVINDAPKALKSKARSRCKTWSKELKGFKRANTAKRKAKILRCVGRYIAVRSANREQFNSEVLHAPRDTCRDKAGRIAERRRSHRKTYAASAKRAFMRRCVGRRSLRALNRLYNDMA